MQFPQVGHLAELDAQNFSTKVGSLARKKGEGRKEEAIISFVYRSRGGRETSIYLRTDDMQSLAYIGFIHKINKGERERE